MHGAEFPEKIRLRGGAGGITAQLLAAGCGGLQGSRLGPVRWTPQAALEQPMACVNSSRLAGPRLRYLQVRHGMCGQDRLFFGSQG